MSPSRQLRLVEPPGPSKVALDDRLRSARRAQTAWAERPVDDRLAVIRDLRHRIAENADALAGTIRLRHRSRAETLASEVLPLADACRFLEREAGALLAPRALGRRGRPFWLGGSDVEIRREPWGLVLVIGPANYPLLLPGVQLVQALVAGNAVVVKPGRDGSPAIALLAELLRQSGLRPGLLTVFDESPDAASDAIAAGVEKVLLTGSRSSGEAVLRQLAGCLTPATLELSGCDPVFVLDDADLDLVTRALDFGLRWNGSFTCIAPRRVYVARKRAGELEERLFQRLHDAEPIPIGAGVVSEARRLVEAALAEGALIAVGDLPEGSSMRPMVVTGVTQEMEMARADVAAPLLSLSAFDDQDQALALAEQCPYALGATIFSGTADASECSTLASRVSAGVVVVNDLIVPTADPRVPFGGRKASGFGVTRGAEGLLELSRTKAVIRRRGRFRPHLEPAGADEERLLRAFVQISHARKLTKRARALFDAFRILIRRPRRT